MAVKTVIPGDDKENALFLYHPRRPGAHRLTIPKDPSEREEYERKVADLKRDGWTEKRFAQMMFHRIKGSKVVTDPKEIPGLRKQGWADGPFKDGTHPDSVHPHENDDHRRIALSESSSPDDDGPAAK